MEQRVGQPSRKDRSDDPQQGVDRDDLRGRGQRISLDLLQEQHAPAVDGVARDVHEGARQRQHPDEGVADDRTLEFGGGPVVVALLGRLLAGQHLYRRQALRFGGVMQ